MYGLQGADFPRPDAWPQRGWRTRRESIKVGFGFVFFAFATLLCLAIALEALSAEPAMAKYAFAFAAMFASIGVFPFFMRPRFTGELRTEMCEVEGLPATRIRYSVRPVVGVCALCGSFALMFGMATADAVEDSGFPGGIPFLIGLLFFGSAPLLFAVGRLQVGWIAFSDRGIHQRGWSFESFVPWTSVLGADAVFPGYPATSVTVLFRDDSEWRRRNTAGFLKIDPLPPGPGIRIDHRKMRDDPVLVNEFVVREVERRRQFRFGPAGTVPSAAAIPVSPATWPDTGRPAEWPRRGWRTTRDYVKVTLSMLMFAAVAGVCVAGAVVDLRDGGTASVKYFVAAAAVCVSICSFPFVLRPWSNGELTTESCELDGQPATRIRYSARPPIALCLLFGTFVLIFGMAAIDSAEDSGLPGALPFATAALFFASLPLSFLVGRLQVGWIAFSDRGIHQRGWSFESFVPWTDVVNAHALFPGYPMTMITVLERDGTGWQRRNTAWFWKIDRLPPTAMIEIDHRKMRDDPVLVHDFIVREVEAKQQSRRWRR